MIKNVRIALFSLQSSYLYIIFVINVYYLCRRSKMQNKTTSLRDGTLALKTKIIRTVTLFYPAISFNLRALLTRCECTESCENGTFATVITHNET